MTAAAVSAATLCALLCGALVVASPADPNAAVASDAQGARAAPDAAPAGGRAGFGGVCTDSSQCSTLNAECISGKCNCNASDVHVRGKCLLPIGGKCGARQCDADNSHCSVGICVCLDGFKQTYNNTYCYKEPKQHNEYCEIDGDCSFLSGEGRCLNNKCRCSSTTAFNNNKCMRKIDELGRHCVKETEVCYLERDGDKQKVECKDNICTCKMGAKPSKDNQSCGGAGALQAVSLTASVIALLLAKVLA